MNVLAVDLICEATKTKIKNRKEKSVKIERIQLDLNGIAEEFYYRPESVGDNGVVQQIFKNEDYSFKRWKHGRYFMQYYKRKFSPNERGCIIDAGANIGASAKYFLSKFPNTFLYAIEPEINNWKLLEKNTEKYWNKHNFLGALSNHDGEMSLSTAGRQDWAFRTTPKDTAIHDQQTVACISVPSILNMEEVRGMKPLILKIDVEGAEQYVFDGDTSWMARFPLIIIELHDWMMPFSGSSRNFLKSISEHNFDFLHKGENIFLFNGNILSD